jgi:hypothetical protein
MTPNVLNMHIVHKTLLKSPPKHCQMVFSRFLSMSIFIPAENTRHSENPGQNPGYKPYLVHSQDDFSEFLLQNKTEKIPTEF